MAWWIPVLQAIGMNAAKNVVTGQDPLKGSIEAGVTGGILGGFSPASSGAEVSGVGSSTGGVAGVGNVPNAAGAGGGISSAIPGSLESEGLLQFNSATGTYLNPSQYVGESTIYKSWEDMLDSNLPTSQQIIERTLSGSNFIKLNIDYSDFNNFVFYSSAKE